MSSTLNFDTLSLHFQNLALKPKSSFELLPLDIHFHIQKHLTLAQVTELDKTSSTMRFIHGPLLWQRCQVGSSLLEENAKIHCPSNTNCKLVPFHEFLQYANGNTTWMKPHFIKQMEIHIPKSDNTNANYTNIYLAIKSLSPQLFSSLQRVVIHTTNLLPIAVSLNTQIMELSKSINSIVEFNENCTFQDLHLYNQSSAGNTTFLTYSLTCLHISDPTHFLTFDQNQQPLAPFPFPNLASLHVDLLSHQHTISLFQLLPQYPKLSNFSFHGSILVFGQEVLVSRALCPPHFAIPSHVTTCVMIVDDSFPRDCTLTLPVSLYSENEAHLRLTLAGVTDLVPPVQMDTSAAFSTLSKAINFPSTCPRNAVSSWSRFLELDTWQHQLHAKMDTLSSIAEFVDFNNTQLPWQFCHYSPGFDCLVSVTIPIAEPSSFANALPHHRHMYLDLATLLYHKCITIQESSAHQINLSSPPLLLPPGDSHSHSHSPFHFHHNLVHHLANTLAAAPVPAYPALCLAAFHFGALRRTVQALCLTEALFALLCLDRLPALKRVTVDNAHLLAPSVHFLKLVKQKKSLETVLIRGKARPAKRQDAFPYAFLQHVDEFVATGDQGQDCFCCTIDTSLNRD